MSATHFSGPVISEGGFQTGASSVTTSGDLWLQGNSTTRITSTSAINFFQQYVESTATSGDSRSIYNRLYISGAGGGGESLRTFTTVNNVAASTAHGAHISLNFAASGSVTGQGIAGRNTLHVPDAAVSGGTYSALQAEIWSDGASSDISGATEYSFIRVVAGGNATGISNVDDNAVLFEFSGVTAGSGTLLNTDITTHTAYGGIPVKVPGVGVRYIALVSN